MIYIESRETQTIAEIVKKLSPAILTLQQAEKRALAIQRGEAIGGLRVERFNKAEDDFATGADKYLDKFLRTRMGFYIPDTPFLTEDPSDDEEKNNLHEDDIESIMSAEDLIVGDSLCGTTNFDEGKDTFAIGMTHVKKGNVVSAGVIHKGETIVAHINIDGVWCVKSDMQAVSLKLSDETNLSGSRFATGSKKENWDITTSPIPQWAPQIKEKSKGLIKTTRSPLVDMINIFRDGNHEGINGLFYNNVHLWEQLPIAFLVRKAGGFVTNGQGGDNMFDARGVIAANNELTHFNMSQLTRVHLSSANKMAERRFDREINGRLQENSVILYERQAV